MTNERSCPCRSGVVTATTGIAPFLRKLKSLSLLPFFAVVCSVVLLASATSAFGQQFHGITIAKQCAPATRVCDTDADCSGAEGECQQNHCDTTIPNTTNCSIKVTNSDEFLDTIQLAGAFDSIQNSGGPTRNPASGNLPIIQVSGTTTCTVSGSLPCNIGPGAFVVFSSTGYNPTPADPDPLQDQANITIIDQCDAQGTSGCSSTQNIVQFSASSDLVNGCSVQNKADSTACADNTPGDCKTAGCESGVCVQTHANVSDSTACTSVDDIAGDCGTPGCESGVCVANHVHVPDSTACSVGVTGTPNECSTPGCESGVCVATHIPKSDSTPCTDTVAGDCKTAGCEGGVCVQTHANVADSTACSVGVTGTPNECATPGCESGVCVASHVNKADSTVCTDTTPECGSTAGCEAGSCVQTHAPQSCGQGCTPGFWKNNAVKKGANAWPVAPTTTLSQAGFVIPGCLSSCANFSGNTTLAAALSLQGGNDACGKAETLIRAAVAAFLNASSTCVSFDLNPTSVVAETNTALASCDGATIIAEATRLDGLNNLGCPINQNGVCQNP